jgi:adiponectin receptor
MLGIMKGWSVYSFPVVDTDAPTHAVYPAVFGRYRRGGTYARNILSLFELHTETVNAWTMIAASIGSVIATSRFAPYCAVFWVFTLSALLHLPFSVGYHLFMSMQSRVFKWWRRADISAMLWASVMLTYAFSLMVLPWWGILLNTILSSMVANIGTQRIRQLQAQQPVHGPSLSAIVATAAACYWWPIAYAAIVYPGPWTVLATIGVPLVLGASAWVYSTHWPQRIAPGQFDVLGHSHQLMHIGVVACHAMEWMFLYEQAMRVDIVLS